MTEPTEEKKTRKRRPTDKVVADLKLRVLRHEWKGVIKAASKLEGAVLLIQEAKCDAGAMCAQLNWETPQADVAALWEALKSALPQELREP